MRGRAVIGLAGLGIVALLLYLLSGVMLPFVAGLALAYLLDPMADRLQRLGLGRLSASLLILAMFVVGLVVILLIVVPLAANQISALVTTFPGMVSRLQGIIVERVGPILTRVGGADVLNDLQSSVGALVGQGGTWFLAFLKSLWSGSQALVSIASLLVVTPVVAFYLLVDWDRMVATVDGWTPPRHRTTVRRLAGEIDRAIIGFVRGQTLVCLILGTFYAVGPVLRRGEFRRADRDDRGFPHLHPLCRHPRRLPSLGGRRPGPVLADIGLAPYRADRRRVRGSASSSKATSSRPSSSVTRSACTRSG